MFLELIIMQVEQAVVETLMQHLAELLEMAAVAQAAQILPMVPLAVQTQAVVVVGLD
jgi:hypothetical protein